MPIAGIEQPSVIQVHCGLRLRKFDGRFDFAYKWYQDVETVYLVDGVRKTYDWETLERMYRWLDSKGELYFIEALESDGYRPIGDVTFWAEDLPIVIGDSAYRGKGVGRKVIGALVQRARALGWSRLYVNEIYNYNIGSRRCFELAGFRVCEEKEHGVRMILTL